MEVKLETATMHSLAGKNRSCKMNMKKPTVKKLLFEYQKQFFYST